MSKRFGRNQKRKLREKVNSLEETVQRAEIINKRTSTKHSILQSELKYLLSMILERFPQAMCLDPEIKEVVYSPMNKIVVPMTSVLTDFIDYVSDKAVRFEEYREKVLCELQFLFSKNHDSDALGIHMLVKDKTIRYFVDYDYVRKYGFNEKAVFKFFMAQWNKYIGKGE